MLTSEALLVLFHRSWPSRAGGTCRLIQQIAPLPTRIIKRLQTGLNLFSRTGMLSKKIGVTALGRKAGRMKCVRPSAKKPLQGGMRIGTSKSGNGHSCHDQPLYGGATEQTDKKARGRLYKSVNR